MPTHYEGSEATVRALNAFINLTRACESLNRRVDAGLGRAELTLAQLAVLEAVYHLGPMCQKALAQKLLRSDGNVTIVVNNLEKRGLVRRVRQTEDKRFTQIELTANGRDLIARIFPRHAEEIARQFSVLDPEEQEVLRRICRKLGTTAKEQPEERIDEETEHAADSTE